MPPQFYGPANTRADNPDHHHGGAGGHSSRKSEATDSRSVTRAPCGRYLAAVWGSFPKRSCHGIFWSLSSSCWFCCWSRPSLRRDPVSSKAASQAGKKRRSKLSAASARITNWLASLLPMTSPGPPKRSGHSHARPTTRKTSIDTTPGSGSLAAPSALLAGAGAMTSASCR